MVIEEIRLDRLEMPLKHPFETSFGKLMKRDFVVVSATSDGITGYGESTAFLHSRSLFIMKNQLKPFSIY